MKLREIRELFKDRKVYDIAAAMRGPDDYTGEEALGAKIVTTTVIRYYVGAPSFAWVYSAQEAQAYWSTLIPKEQDAVRAFMSGNGHFRCHVEAAFRALEKHSRSAKAHYMWLKKEDLLP